MVLDSQMARAGGERRYMASRRRSNLKLPAVIVVLAIIAGVCYWIVDASDGTGNATASGGNGAANTPPPSQQAGLGGSTNDEPRRETRANPTASSNDRRSTPAASSPDTRSGNSPSPSPRREPAATSGSDNTTADRDDDSGSSRSTGATELRKIAQARALIEDDRLVEARELLNDAMKRPMGDREAEAVRQLLGQVNAKLIFSPYVDPNDPISDHYVMKSGEILGKVAPRYDVPWKFIARINDVRDVRRIRAGQRLKVIQGPFHAVVDKSDYRLDLYLQVAGDPHGLFIRSFEIGVGKHDSTPIGKFIVKKGSKLVNPEWTNPRTGEVFYADDPRNPIGERWIGLRGIDASTKTMQGYGIHGTIEPESIGQQASMGCIRMRPDDVALVYDMLEQEQSTVVVQR